MTGFGQSESHSEDYEVKVEIKGLNGKYLDLSFRMPRFLTAFELKYRNLLSSQLGRGSITISINVNKLKVDDGDAKVNKELAKRYYADLKELSEDVGAGDQDIFRIVTMMQDVIYQDEQEVDPDLSKQVEKALLEAYAKFDGFRQTEGETVRHTLQEYSDKIANCIPFIAELEPERIESTKQRLKKNLTALLEDDSYDKNRFEQELIYYLEKYDLSEEKIRLKSHCDHFAEVLSTSPKGKKLNFIAQEMGREINTIGSKANHSGIQRLVVEMKEELEKIKEQVLNIL